MAENAYTQSTEQTTNDTTAADLDASRRAIWNVNSLLESDDDDLAAELAASYERDLAQAR